MSANVVIGARRPDSSLDHRRVVCMFEVFGMVALPTADVAVDARADVEGIAPMERRDGNRLACVGAGLGAACGEELGKYMELLLLRL